MRIYKFRAPDPDAGQLDIAMPAGSNIVCFDFQGDGLFLWAMVFPNEDRVTRTFMTVGTGRDFPDGSAHRGTALYGVEVWHLIELEPKPFV